MTSDPDQIRSSIEQTQQNLSVDVDALTDKVSPPKIVERRVQQTRSAMTSVKERIMGSTSDRTSSLGGTVSSSASSARDTVASTASSAADMAGSAPDLARQRTRGNPLAAGLIAFGAGWLVASLLPATETEQQAASQVKDLAAEKGRPVVQQLSQAGQEAAQELRESAQQRAQSVRETATDAASTVRDEAQSHASDVTDHAQEARGRVAEQAGSDGSS
jgi:cell division septum initiation protein DivIVA